MTGQAANLESHPEFVSMRRDITDMKGLMTQMVEAMSRIAVIEERHSSLANTSEKVLEQLQQVVKAQHQTELVNAVNADLAGRVKTLEEVVRDSHVEDEKNKARFDTIVFLVRAAWAVIGTLGFGGMVWIASLVMRVAA